MESQFCLHTKQYYKVVKEREARGLYVDQNYKRMVDNSRLFTDSPEMFEKKLNFKTLHKIKFL